ncbi:uncharacterized protein LOC110893415 [Helianthus annuus]|uniref:uncharacterized protein LOC110893415 n=1 Tax=Helianthus annuus TaxID=4232 RepID=UPI0016530145|nr:uncharacterized protein LOC110893415 [Helianthus annuus]
MVRLKITKTNEELVNKLANVLPGDGWRTYLSDLRKMYLDVNLSLFIEKIKERELELQKINNAETDEAKVKSEEIVREKEEQVKEISAIKVETKAEAVNMTEKCSNFVEVEIVNEIKEVKVENVKVEEKVAEKVVVNVEVEKVVTEEQLVVEDEKKTKSLTEEKNENLEAGDAGDEVGVEEKQNDADLKQTEAAENTEVIQGNSEDQTMAEEFYNTFFNAFTSESSEVTTVTPKTITKAINENIKHDNFYGTHSKPPTLESIEDYTWWKERFINWAKAYAHESWFCLEYGYEKPKDDKGEDLQFKKFSRDDRAEFAAEQRMIALIQSAIRNDIFALLNHSGTSKSIESHDLELQKQSKMTESSRQQNVGLYYKSSVLSEKGVGSPKTAFVEEDRNDIVRKTAHGKATTAPRKFANVAEIKEEKEPAKNHEEKIENKEKTRKEILSEKTHKERDVVYRRMDEMQEEYENAVSNKRWDKKRECYYNREGEPVAEEVETEAVKVEAVKEVEEQQIEEEEMKDVKSDAGDAGEEVSVEQKLNDAEMKQPEEAENTEVFLKKTECQPKENRNSLAPEAADPCNG